MCIRDSVTAALMEEGLSQEEARRRCWFVDSKGLVVKSRTDLVGHKLPYAHDHAFLPDLLSAVENLAPTAIIGVAGQPGTFTQEVVQAMARFNTRPIIFAMSNPTSKQECSATEAYTWTDGRAIFTSGSPSAPVNFNGSMIVPGQGNNAYISVSYTHLDVYKRQILGRDCWRRQTARPHGHATGQCPAC